MNVEEINVNTSKTVYIAEEFCDLKIVNNIFTSVVNHKGYVTLYIALWQKTMVKINSKLSPPLI